MPLFCPDAAAETLVVGYDVAAMERTFLKFNGHEEESVAEMLLTRGPTYEYKVGRSNREEYEWTTKTGDFAWPDHVAPAVVRCTVHVCAWRVSSLAWKMPSTRDHRPLTAHGVVLAVSLTAMHAPPPDRCTKPQPQPLCVGLLQPHAERAA